MDRRILRLPKLVQCDDYHEFADLQAHLRVLTGHNLIKVKEVGFNGSYIGVVYVFQKPTRDELNKLCKKQNIELWPDDNI